MDGEDIDLYVEHMKVAEEFATVNHKVIVHEICSHMGWNVVDSIFTHHNYIEFLGNREMIIRKGAISAKKGEREIIPLNMKDGSIVGVGKGNDEWNQSAPHGAALLARQRQIPGPNGWLWLSPLPPRRSRAFPDLAIPAGHIPAETLPARQVPVFLCSHAVSRRNRYTSGSSSDKRRRPQRSVPHPG